MKRSAQAHVISLACVLLSAVGYAAGQVSATQAPVGVRQVAPAKHVMAPPLEMRAVVKVRPSSAEAGSSRTTKPPLRTLPAMHVSSRTSASQSVVSLQHTGHWLMLYRTDHCVACDRLMNVLAASDSADLRNGIPYTIVVGSPSASSLNDVRAKYSTLADANWAADLDRSTFDALQLRGAPELFAMDGSRIVWKVSGNLGNPQQVLRLADSWIAGTGAADAAATSKSAAPPTGSATAAPVKR